MKKAKLLYGALAMLAFTACSDDNAPDNGIASDGEEQFITLQISNAGSFGRADEPRSGESFDNGTADENKIETLQLVFYGSAGEVLATKSVTLSESDYQKNTNPQNVEAVITKVVSFTLRAGSPRPTQLMVYANPISVGSVNFPLSNIPTSTRTTYYNKKDENNKPLFTMNNSVYYDANNKLVRAVKIADTQIFEKENDAQEVIAEGATEADKAKIINVHIERIAAKVTLKGSSSNGTDFATNTNKLITENVVIANDNGTTETTQKNFQFVVDGWGFTAENKATYVTKFLPENISEVQVSIFDGWNNPTNFRSYWAQSVGFDKVDENNFPKISDDVRTYDPTTNNQLVNQQTGANQPYHLKYNSFKDIQTLNMGLGTSQYLLENTTTRGVQNGAFRNSALTSVILIGHYEITDNTTSEADETPSTPKTFYRYSNQIWLDDNIFKYWANIQNIIKVKTTVDGKDQYIKPTLEQAKTIFKVAHLSSTSSDKQMENLVTLMLTKNAVDETTKLYYETINDEGATQEIEVTDENRAEINALLKQSLGYAEAYTEGKAYFPILIKHLGTHNDGVDETGTYAVVRNHSYNITIDAIEGFGIGVYNPEQPIVPPTESKTLYIASKINVLSWRLVPTQNVTLK